MKTVYRNVGESDLHLHDPQDKKVILILEPDAETPPMELCEREQKFLVEKIGFLQPVRDVPDTLPFEDLDDNDDNDDEGEE